MFRVDLNKLADNAVSIIKILFSVPLLTKTEFKKFKSDLYQTLIGLLDSHIKLALSPNEALFAVSIIEFTLIFYTKNKIKFENRIIKLIL